MVNVLKFKMDSIFLFFVLKGYIIKYNHNIHNVYVQAGIEAIW